VQSRAQRVFSHFYYPAGKVGGAQIRRCQGIAVRYYGFTLGALALRPSDFCNAGVDVYAIGKNVTSLFVQIESNLSEQPSTEAVPFFFSPIDIQAASW
jgi:hypothetical protein